VAFTNWLQLIGVMITSVIRGSILYTSIAVNTLGEFVYAVTAAEDVILSLFASNKQ